MRNTITTIIKILAGISAILIPFFLVVYVADNLIYIHDYHLLKWIALLIGGLGFYISGLINRKTPLKWIPFLYISLLWFYPMRFIYFPFFIFIILFATISLFVTRKEFARKYRLFSLVLIAVLFIYFLFSQPLIIRKTKEITYYNDKVQNSFVVWDFTNKKSNQLPELIYYDVDNNPVDLKKLKNKTLYISYWATWCGPCMKEKAELEKLKTHFEDSIEIIFVDVLLDDSHENWLRYLNYSKPKGLQLMSKNAAKTRELLEISGIPVHIVVNAEGLYRKERIIGNAYALLSNRDVLTDFVNGKESKEYTQFILTKIKDNTLKTFEIIVPDTTEYFITQENNSPLKLINFINANYAKMAKVGVKFPKYVYFCLENTIQRNDSIINMGYFKTSDVVLQTLKSTETKE